MKQDFFESSHPSSECYEASRPARFGEVHVFLSHSWHDDVALKWAALQTWGSEFRLAHDCEPLIWFDRCCIDQEQIQVGLRCLPVYLSACQDLLCLRGPSYLSRLWCVVELFVFHLINPKGTVVVRALDADADHATAGQDAKLPAAFDVRSSLCTDPEDKDRLMSVIESAAGKEGIQTFNTWIEEQISGNGRRSGGPSFSKRSSSEKSQTTSKAGGTGKASTVKVKVKVPPA
mmetsp:Transcript_23944/g.80425  ORF Transcript_23944/g.80425 Transcript_23944/m.80425 type:complete len:232 (+) Transcript_23944:1421-2116(+)